LQGVNQSSCAQPWVQRPRCIRGHSHGCTYLIRAATRLNSAATAYSYPSCCWLCHSFRILHPAAIQASIFFWQEALIWYPRDSGEITFETNVTLLLVRENLGHERRIMIFFDQVLTEAEDLHMPRNRAHTHSITTSQNVRSRPKRDVTLICVNNSGSGLQARHTNHNRTLRLNTTPASHSDEHTDEHTHTHTHTHTHNETPHANARTEKKLVSTRPLHTTAGNSTVAYGHTKATQKRPHERKASF
jgi:hypothetical protein